MSILVLTRSDDNDCAKLVAAQLQRMGRQVLRLDTDHYPTGLKLTSDPVGETWIRSGSENYRLNDLSAIWYRRFLAGGQLPLELGETREVCVHEARRTLYGTIAASPAFQLDPLICVRKADHKELQLRRAHHFGLQLPKTLFSNDAEQVKQFFDAQGGQLVAKMQSSFAMYRRGEEYVVFTTRLDESQLAELDRLCYCPMIFQELLPKKLDIRATVVGKRVFTAAIDSQKAPLTSVDWRRDGAGTLDDWFPFQLPAETEQSLLRLVEDFGLNYAAADFVLTADDRLVFLEINAGGEWLWLCSHHGLPIDLALAEVLAGEAERTVSWPWVRASQSTSLSS
jgi:hypothetical protein